MLYFVLEYVRRARSAGKLALWQWVVIAHPVSLQTVCGKFDAN